MNRNFLTQAWLLFVILLSNFAAQVAYFYHLYYSPQHPFPNARSALIMGSVLVLFLVSFVLLISKYKVGFPLMIFYLSLEFLFYLWNIVTNGLRQGYGWFFHLREHDPILWIVFAIGYLSFFASGYFLVLLIFRRKSINPHYDFVINTQREDNHHEVPPNTVSTQLAGDKHEIIARKYG